MLTPQDIENKSFTKAVRGYDTAEVDEYIAVLLENYARLYTICGEYDRKFRSITRSLQAIRDNEEANRAAAKSAQQIYDGILDEANLKAEEIIRNATAEAKSMIAVTQKKCDDRMAASKKQAEELAEESQLKSDALLYAAKLRCSKVLNEFGAELVQKKAELDSAKKNIELFKATLFQTYKSHIDGIKSLIPAIDITIDPEFESKFTAEVLQGIKTDAIELVQNTPAAPEPMEETAAESAAQEGAEPGVQAAPTPAPEAARWFEERPADAPAEALIEEDEDDVKVFTGSVGRSAAAEMDEDPLDIAFNSDGKAEMLTDDEEYTDEFVEESYDDDQPDQDDRYAQVAPNILDVKTGEIDMMDEDDTPRKARGRIFNFLKGKKDKNTAKDDIGDTDTNIETENNIFEGFDN